MSYTRGIVVACLLLCGCRILPENEGRPVPLPLIPLPAVADRCAGSFEVRSSTAVVLTTGDPQAETIVRNFSALVERTAGRRFDVHTGVAAKPGHSILFELQAGAGAVDTQTGDESYTLDVSPEQIRLSAATPHGLFNGSMTLWQLLTPGQGPAANDLRVPCVRISDRPRFAWRGLLLDSARHFQPPEFVKRFIDDMAMHKLNVMHWHLTDDQGWRIEIKRYPKLTEIGAWRAPQPDEAALADPATGKYGGFYTQQQIRDIVRYAAERYVTIVPEIDMPGHAQAAIASYPQIGVTGKQPPVSPDWGINTYIYNVDESTFTFIGNVLTEVMDLFPSPYIHVGGDEAAKDQWQASAHVQERMHRLGIRDEQALQGYFTARLEAFLRAHGRGLIGWDEILEGGLPAGAIVMSWRGKDGAIAAAKHGDDVIMSPDPVMYLDHLQSSASDEPAGRIKILSLADVYGFDVVPKELDAEQARHVLGAQANLWSEYFTTPQRVEYAAFPRAAALAERVWTAPERTNWAGFVARLPAQVERYRKLGINFSDSALAPQISLSPTNDSSRIRVEISMQVAVGSIRYTLDGSAPQADSEAYRGPLTVKQPRTLRATTFAGDRMLATRTQRIESVDVRRLHSDRLKLCSDSLLLRLEGGADETLRMPLYNVDLMNPCWIYPQVDLGANSRIDVRVGALPNFFQLWHDTDKVVKHTPSGAGDELQVRLDHCDGPVARAIPLGADPAATVSVDFRAQGGVHDVCLVFAQSNRALLRLVDWIEPVPN